MPELIPNLPAGSTILFNHLNTLETPEYSIEDLFAAALPGPDATHFDIGWQMDAGGPGEYVVRVFAAGEEAPLEPPLVVRDLRHAIRVVELLAREYVSTAPATVPA